VLIRAARWGALATGIVYAYFRNESLRKYYYEKMIAEQELREFIIARQKRYLELKDLESQLDTYKMVFGHEKAFNQADEDLILSKRQKGVEERKAKRDYYYSQMGEDTIKEIQAKFGAPK
jgi:hypothetical protein